MRGARGFGGKNQIEVGKSSGGISTCNSGLENEVKGKPRGDISGVGLWPILPSLTRVSQKEKRVLGSRFMLFMLSYSKTEYNRTECMDRSSHNNLIRNLNTTNE